jgi:hypothetical protein
MRLCYTKANHILNMKQGCDSCNKAATSAYKRRIYASHHQMQQNTKCSFIKAATAATKLQQALINAAFTPAIANAARPKMQLQQSCDSCSKQHKCSCKRRTAQQSKLCTNN